MGTVLDPSTIPETTGSPYPEAFRSICEGRRVRRLTEPLGLVNFAVNIVTLDPGAGSSQRHWHTKQDEFVHVLEGRPTLVTDAGAQELSPGMVAGFPAGDGDGHHFLNRTDAPVVFLVVGDRAPGDQCHYPDVDLHMRVGTGANVFSNKQGVAY